VQTADNAASRARQAVLDEAGRVDPRGHGHSRIERTGEEPALVYMGCRLK
jgi:hypothetical protein